MQEVQTILPNGSLVRDRYVVERMLGKGGFGAVYLVRDVRVQGNQFALKEVIDPNKAARQRFAFEGEVLKRLDHHALPRVYRAFEDAPTARAYLLMDYIAGPNLEGVRLQQPAHRFSLLQAMTIIAPVVEAVSYLHAQKPPIIHRDIKPANIIVPTAGGGAVLVDFGIAKEYEQDGTTTAVRHGSPGYSAPEQYARGTNLRTDVYALAATLYTLLTGTVPADALWRLTQMESKGTDPLVPVNRLAPHIPVVVAEAIQQAMSINRNERFASVGALWRALQSQPIKVASHAPLTPLPETRLAPQESTPAMAALSTTGVSSSSRTHPLRRRAKGLIVLTLIALGALLAGVLLGTNLLSGPQSAATNTHHARATHAPPMPTATHPTATTQATPTTAQPTPKHQPSPAARSTPPPAVYPVLQAEYGGTIQNDPAAVGTTLSLSQVRQSGTTMSGYLTVGPQLQGNGTFTGMVSTKKDIRFLVHPYGGHLPLLFTGQVNADGSLSGTYCSALANQCDYHGGGYGTWNVSPISLGS